MLVKPRALVGACEGMLMATAALASSHREAPFMDAEPPHWVARGLTIVILSLFGIGLIAAVVIEVPETVSGPFRLVPIEGSDPVRVSRSEIRPASCWSTAAGVRVPSENRCRNSLMVMAG